MVLLVKQLHRLRIFIEGEHHPWVILVPDNAFPIIVSFDQDADLFCDEVADALAASMALVETVCVDLQLSRYESGSVGVVVIMKTGVYIPVTARVKRVLEKIANKGGAQLGNANCHQEIEVMPREVLDFVHEEDIEILLHACHDSVDQIGLLDVLGESVCIEPAAGSYEASVVCQCITRECRRELERHAFGVLF